MDRFDLLISRVLLIQQRGQLVRYLADLVLKVRLKNKELLIERMGVEIEGSRFRLLQVGELRGESVEIRTEIFKLTTKGLLGYILRLAFKFEISDQTLFYLI